MEQPRIWPYVHRFASIFLRECYRTWRGELFASVCVAVVSFVISRQRDAAAWENLKITTIATVLALVGFAAWHLIRTPFLLHRETVKRMEEEHAQEIEAERQAIRNQREHNVTAKDWRDLAEKFETACRFVRADYQLGTRIPYDYWTLAGAHGSCEAWIKQAGAMLMKSPAVCAELSAGVVSEPDALKRWLKHLKDKGCFHGEFPLEERLEDGTVNHILLGSTRDLAVDSARLCIECSALET